MCKSGGGGDVWPFWGGYVDVVAWCCIVGGVEGVYCGEASVRWMFRVCTSPLPPVSAVNVDSESASAVAGSCQSANRNTQPQTRPWLGPPTAYY
ncbi:hypothetical protein O3P69_019655 [Scylla paramamosain]|uniref:Uncharacterized protein n=1 Tax=Scylla paramamosain TaxID=85552 RepID=A0AAW0SWL0_SCYPA